MIALFPIKPVYARLIVEGSKVIEVRRGRINDAITAMVVYATKPKGVVLGAVDVLKVEHFSAHEFRAFITSRRDPLEPEALRYVEGAQWVSVLFLARPRRLARPMALAELFPAMRPSQFWQAIEGDLPPELV